MTLQEFFAAHPEAALAFSGGADSAYLLWAAVQYGRRVRAYYVQSPFQPAFELADARRLAKGLGADMRVLAVDVLALPEAAGNPPDRCYHCKHALFSAISAAAEADGFSLLIDGTNASDSAGDRPGMRALRELSVRSPLRECGLEKAEIRRLSREAGLFTWDKPAYACLATRIPAGEVITAEKLRGGGLPPRPWLFRFPGTAAGGLRQDPTACRAVPPASGHAGGNFQGTQAALRRGAAGFGGAG